MKTEDLKKLIRDVPDFPKKGIIFKDITPLLQNPEAFKFAIDAIAAKYRGKKIDSVVCIESRGFIFGAALSYALDVGLVLVRKKGKLPYKTHAVTYDLEYGTDTLEVHRDSIKPGDKVLI
ncbi:MAG: adenine phosphoribosyltransferase, partial [Candidatus Omnitrophota bacterium]